MKKILFLFLLCSLLYGNSEQGDREFKNGNYIKAIEYYKQSTIEEDKYLYIKLAQSYTRLGDNFLKIYNFKEAKKYYQEAINIGGRLAQSKLAKLYEKEADIYYKGKKYLLALSLYKKSYALGNKNLERKIKKVTQSLEHEQNLIDDTRKTVTTNSPIWTYAIGRLIIPTKFKREKNRTQTKIKKCSATLVNFEQLDSSKVIVTASHCISEFNKNAGLLRFIIKTKENQIIQKYATIYKDSKFDPKLKKTSDYAILILSSPILKKDVEPVIIDKRSFVKLQKEYQYHFASLGGFSSDVGDYGTQLTYDPKCKIKYYNNLYGKSNCSGFKGASGGPVVLTTSQDKKNEKFYFVGVVSHFKGKKFNEIYFAPHDIFYNSLKKAIERYNQ